MNSEYAKNTCIFKSVGNTIEAIDKTKK